MTFIFLHIPKTAGTFVDSVVRASSVTSLHNVGTLIEKIAKVNSKNCPAYIGGHMNINILSEYVEDLKSHNLVSLVRHPFDRFISAVNYLVEILSRGIDFYMSHPLGARMKILRTYFLLESGACQDLTHLFEQESTNYMARFLIPDKHLSQMKNMEVSECISILSKCISQYDFLMSVENGGAQSLLEYTCQQLKIDPSALPSPNRNSSDNYVDLQNLIKSGFIDYNRQNSRIDFLLYLMIHENPSENILRSMTWEDISLKSEELFFRNSNYISKPYSKISEKAIECVKDILQYKQ